MTYDELLLALGQEIKKQCLGYCGAEEVTFQNGVALVSHSIMLAAKINNKYYFTAKHDCQRAVVYRALNVWCGIDAPTRHCMIKSGEAVLVEKSNTNFIYL